MHRSLPRTLLVLLLASTAALVFVGRVSAHTELRSADPAPGEVVSGRVEVVDLEFFGPVTDASIIVTDPDGDAVEGSVAALAPEAVRFQADAPLDVSGEHTVDYRVVSEDGDPSEGSFVFTWESADDTTPVVTWIGGALVVVIAAGAGWLLLGRPGLRGRSAS